MGSRAIVPKLAITSEGNDLLEAFTLQLRAGATPQVR
jgi:hypothetical protein